MRAIISHFRKTCISITLMALLSLVLVSQANAAYFFTDDFSDNSAGWTLGVEWQIAPAQASTGHTTNGGGNPDPAMDHTPTADNGVAGVVIGGNAATVTHPYYYLTSPNIDLSTATGTITLDFYRWLNSDYTPYMQNTIDVFDGSSWNTIWQTGPSPAVQDAAWTYQNFDVSSFTNNNFQVRFGFQIGSSGVFTVSSWNLDDVAIHNNPPAVPVPSALLLMGTGLAGFIALSRRRKDLFRQ